MPYNRVADPLLNVGKPGRSTDWKKFRDNQDYFNEQIDALSQSVLTTDQDIREHFMGKAIDTTNVWTQFLEGTGTITLTRGTDHYAEFSVGGAGDAVLLAAKDGRLRIKKSEEYIAYMTIRVKRTGVDGEGYAFGWNDDGLGDVDDSVQDVSDFVGVTRDAGGNWLAFTANGGSTTSVGPFGTATNWHAIRLEFTCSATAGNRKLDVYLDDVLVGTASTDASMPTALLRPVVGCHATGATARTMRVDYIEFGFLNRPTAA